MEQKSHIKHSVPRLVAVVIMLVTIATSSSSVYAANTFVFHMSIYVHNWRCDIAVAVPATDIEVILDEGQEQTEEPTVDEVQTVTEELPVDIEEPEPKGQILTEDDIAAEDEQPNPEETSPVDMEEITASPITEVETKEPINTETEGEINNDENTDTLEPEG